MCIVVLPSWVLFVVFIHQLLGWKICWNWRKTRVGTLWLRPLISLRWDKTEIQGLMVVSLNLDFTMISLIRACTIQKTVDKHRFNREIHQNWSYQLSNYSKLSVLYIQLICEEWDKTLIHDFIVRCWYSKDHISILSVTPAWGFYQSVHQSASHTFYKFVKYTFSMYIFEYYLACDLVWMLSVTRNVFYK